VIRQLNNSGVLKRLWHLIVSPYEEWRHRIFMQGWNAGFSDCEAKQMRDRQAGGK
jgi:hypothetical protein